ncbi:MAG: hypothetical protein ABIF77_07005 [bacterium]
MTFLILFGSVTGAHGQNSQADLTRQYLQRMADDNKTSADANAVWKLANELDTDNAERYCWYLGCFKGASCLFELKMMPLLRKNAVGEALDLADRLYEEFRKSVYEASECDWTRQLYEQRSVEDCLNLFETVMLSLQRHLERLDESSVILGECVEYGGSDLYCRFLYLQAVSHFIREDYNTALMYFDQASTVCDDTRSMLLLSHYGRAQCLRFLKQYELAAQEYLGIMRGFDTNLDINYPRFSLEGGDLTLIPYPDQTLCDEILLHAAECYLALDEAEETRNMLACVKRFCPGSDQAAKATEELAKLK